jgi:hypothetical protein
MDRDAAPDDRFALFINGEPGVGKSTTLEHVGDILAELARPFSLMDVDWFHRSWPPTEDGNRAIEASNIAHVWKSYDHDAPARQLVIAGVIHSERARRRYEDAVGLPIRSVRLLAPRATVLERLEGRYAGERPRALGWHLDHLEEAAVRADAYAGDEFSVETDTDARSVAEQVLRGVGLLS